MQDLLRQAAWDSGSSLDLLWKVPKDFDHTWAMNENRSKAKNHMAWLLVRRVLDLSILSSMSPAEWSETYESGDFADSIKVPPLIDFLKQSDFRELVLSFISLLQ